MTYHKGVASACPAVLFVAAILAFLPVVSAHADAYVGEGLVQVKEKPPKTGGGGSGITTQSTAANGTFYCSVPFAAVQSSPSGFVVGSCSQNTELRRIMRSDLVDVGQGQYDYYEGGYILGSFSGCGWVRSAQSSAPNDTTTVWNHCNPNSIGYTQDEFTYRFSNGSYYYDGCGGGASCSGTLINNRQTCYAVANIRPWARDQNVPSPIRYIPANATVGTLPNGQPASRIAWRYVAKYPTTDGTYWVMVRDRAYTSGQGNWVFVPLSCL